MSKTKQVVSFSFTNLVRFLSKLHPEHDAEMT